MPKPRPVTIVTDDGPRTFPTMGAACRFMRCTVPDLLRRIQVMQAAGLTYDEATIRFYKELLIHRADEKHFTGPKPITIQTADGPLNFPSINAVLRAMGKNKGAADHVLRQFREQGRSDNEAMTAYWNDPVAFNGTSFVLDGVRYADGRDACEKLRIDYRKVVALANRQHISIKNAIPVFIAQKPTVVDTTVEVNGVSYKNLPTACRTLGYKADAVRAAAKKRGMTYGQILSEWTATNHSTDRTLWTKAEEALLRRYYPMFGMEHILSHLFKDSIHTIVAVRTHATSVLKIGRIPRTRTETHVMQFAYKTDDGRFFYWYYCRIYNTLMLLSADEILDYYSRPSAQFCREHMVPPFVHVPSGFISHISNGRRFSYQTWLAANQEVTPPDA